MPIQFDKQGITIRFKSKGYDGTQRVMTFECPRKNKVWPALFIKHHRHLKCNANYIYKPIKYFCVVINQKTLPYTFYLLESLTRLLDIRLGLALINPEFKKCANQIYKKIT